MALRLMRAFGWFLLALLWSLLVGTFVVVAYLWPLHDELTGARTAELWRPGSHRWAPAGSTDCYGAAQLVRLRGGRIALESCHLGAGLLVWDARARSFRVDEAASSPGGDGCGRPLAGDGRRVETLTEADEHGTLRTFVVIAEPSGRCRRHPLGVQVQGERARELPDGRVVVLGSLLASPPADEAATPVPTAPVAQVLEPAASRSLTLPPPGPGIVPADRVAVFDDAVGLDGARLLVIGRGESASGAASVPFAAILDTVARTWTRATPPPSGSGDAVLVALPGGRVAALVGGADGASRVELWSAAEDRWTRLPALAEWRASATMLATADGGLLVAGGNARESRKLLTATHVAGKLTPLALIAVLLALGIFVVRRRRPPTWGIVAGLLPAAPWAVFWIYVLTHLTMPHGRPPRVAGRPRLPRLRRPRVRERGSPSGGLGETERRASPAPLAGACGVPPAAGTTTRIALAVAWAEDARLEQASVTAFTELARDLRALGAPGALVARAERSSRQEARHAARCAALASRHAGVAVEVEPLELAPPVPCIGPARAARLAELATEALVDGCVGEGFAAAAARASLATVEDPEARAALTTIAADEAEHAALARDVLAFCLREGGAAVAGAVERAIVHVATARPHRGLPAGRLTGELARHGRLVEALPGALDAVVRAEVLAWARALLGEARRALAARARLSRCA